MATSVGSSPPVKESTTREEVLSDVVLVVINFLFCPIEDVDSGFNNNDEGDSDDDDRYLNDTHASQGCCCAAEIRYNQTTLHIDDRKFIMV
mmetsp:Transcript_24383/g.27864  ORF Transcript_24383/g.27864 Transcript_24383/m.27864 type:complete len:91 (-) Transcript_24383:108-380(-)